MNTRRISLHSLFWYILRKFWIVCAVAVGFAVLLAGYKFYKDKSAEKSAAKNSDGSGLTEDEKRDVENTYLQYIYLQEAENYYKGSPLMAESAQSEVQTLVEYRILLKNQGTEQSNGTVEMTYLQLLRAFINDGMYIPEVMEKNEAYKDFVFMKELVWCNSSGGGEFSLGVIEYKKFPDLAKDVRESVETYMNKLMAEEPGLSIEAMKEATFNVYDGTTDTAKKNAIANVISYRRAVANAYAAFTTSQQAYFDQLTGKGEEAASVKKAKISWKYAIVGGFVGAVMGLGLLILMLYLSLKHASSADYSENVGLRNFGMLFLPGKRSGGMLRRELKQNLFPTNQESTDYAAIRISTYCKSHEISELAVLSSVNTDSIEKAAASLGQALSKNGIKLHLTESLATDSKALSELLSVKKSIFLESLHGGNRQKMAELLQFCKENEVEVIGALGVAELTLGNRE